MSITPNQVVVGFDFTFGSRVAADRAIALAARAPSYVLHFVCAIEPHLPFPQLPAPDGVTYGYAERVLQAVTSELELALRAAALAEPIHFYVHARIGRAATEILAVARDVGADLIIVGSKGAHGLTRLLLGSVSEEVAREAGCPVEIARPKTYAPVQLLPVIEVEPSHTYVPPHRYYYEDKRVTMRPADWPLYLSAAVSARCSRRAGSRRAARAARRCW